MGNRLSRIFTRTGDKGDTGLGDGSRVDKDHPRIEAIGDIDELNCMIGVLLSSDLPEQLRHDLGEIQHTLFDIGGELSMPGTSMLTGEPAAGLEERLEGYNATLPPLREFILPGGSEASAVCQLARAVCRRAERRLVTLARNEPVNDNLRIYLNRLSDLLFVMSRILNRAGNGHEVYWRSPRSRSED